MASLDPIVERRRRLHQTPELGISLPRTKSIVKAELEAMGYAVDELPEDCLVTSIGSGETAIALRADMDALPVQEETGLPFASVNGNMHACGHDGHMAMLLGAAETLRQRESELNGRVYLCFQSGEETGGGAMPIIEYLKSVGGVERVGALHLWADLPSGHISVVPGPRMAAGCGIYVRVCGVGGHGSRPDLAIDPIKPACAIVLGLSAIPVNRTKSLEPIAVHIGNIEAGATGNVFPAEAHIKGGFRTFTPEGKASVIRAINDVVMHTAAAYGATAELSIKEGLPPVINDGVAVAEAQQVIAKMSCLTPDPFEPIMASENFALFLQEWPGFMAFVGVRNEKTPAGYQHNPTFDIDESVLPGGADFLARYALSVLSTSN